MVMPLLDINQVTSYFGESGLETVQSLHRLAESCSYQLTFNPEIRRFTLLGSADAESDSIERVFTTAIRESWRPLFLGETDSAGNRQFTLIRSFPSGGLGIASSRFFRGEPLASAPGDESRELFSPRTTFENLARAFPSLEEILDAYSSDFSSHSSASEPFDSEDGSSVLSSESLESIPDMTHLTVRASACDSLPFRDPSLPESDTICIRATGIIGVHTFELLYDSEADEFTVLGSSIFSKPKLQRMLNRSEIRERHPTVIDRRDPHGNHIIILSVFPDTESTPST